MAKVTIKPRTGKDFFDYTQRVVINAKLAQDWAIEEFVLIDGEPITIEQISRLSAQVYLKLSGSIFSNNITPASENNKEIEIEGNIIKCKKLSRDFVTELQGVTKNANGNTLKIMKFCLEEFYYVGFSELEKMPYQVVAYLMNKINFFLSQLTESRDEFHLDDLYDTDPATVNT